MVDVDLPPGIDASFFDGRSARALQVRVFADAQHLHAEFDDVHLQWPLADVQWPETTRHGRRVLHLKDGGTLQASDTAAFDRWRKTLGHDEGWIVRAQQHWRWTALAALLLVVVLGAGWRWGVPLAARGVVTVLPASVDEAVGRAALKSLEERWLTPSELPAVRQAQLRELLSAAVAADQAAHANEAATPWRLKFAQADKAIGANALALPGGTLIVTDAMVELLKGEDDALIGVMAHELGHVRHRHGMHGVVQASLVGAAASLIVGDFSALLAGVPAVIAQMGYSREAEREADAHAARLLRASGRSPAAMLVLFERLQPQLAKSPKLPIALASHPSNEERMRYFREAAK